MYSASKSVTSCAVGFAVQEGLLSLEERLVDAFAQDLPETVSENLERATVRDLLTMCLGQARGELMGAQRPLYQERDWVKLALSFPFTDAPNTKFVYSPTRNSSTTTWGPIWRGCWSSGAAGAT